MASRFFQQDNSSSESDNEEPVEQIIATTKTTKTNNKKVKKGPVKEEVDNDQERVVKTEKAKRLENLMKICEVINQGVKILDFTKLFDSFDKLCTELGKTKKLIEEDGYPSVQMKTIIILEDVVMAFTNEQKKKITTANAKSFTKQKQKVKKNNDTMRTEIEEFKKSPAFLAGDEESEKEESEEEESEEESDEESDEKSDTGSDGDNDDDDDSDDKSEWDEDAGEEEEGDQEFDEEKRKKLDREERRKFWLKTPEDYAKKKGGEKKIRNLVKTDKIKKEFDDNVVQFMDFDAIDLTPANITKKITDISINRAQMPEIELKTSIKTLEYILENEKDELKQLELLIVLINLRNELKENVYMERDMWLNTILNLNSFLVIIDKNPEVLDNKILNYLQGDEKKYSYTDLQLIFTSNVQSADFEWNTAVRLLEQSNYEYDCRLRDEINLLKLIVDSISYFKKEENMKIVSSLSFKFLEHIYHHSQDMITKIRERVPDFPVPENTQEFIRELSSNVYKAPANEKYVIKTALYEAYNYAINDEYIKAKDQMLMYKIPENTNMGEGTILMVYNRALVQLGICAFRRGMIIEAKLILDDICTQLKVKELLGQTMPKTSAREDKRKQIPYHLHISFETVESVYLICVMLLEVPFIVAGEKEMEKRNVNKLFQRLWYLYDKNVTFFF